jgi:hypothetical protein
MAHSETLLVIRYSGAGAGIYTPSKRLDSGLRRNDKHSVGASFDETVITEREIRGTKKKLSK